LAALLALLAAPSLRRAALRRRRHAAAAEPTPAPPGVAGLADTEIQHGRQHAHAAWEELTDILIDFGVRVDPAETPRATAERLVAEHFAGGPAAEAARRLSQAEERARYARGMLRVGQLTDALRSVRQALAAEADRRTRMAATLLPRSVLRRWRLGTMDMFTRAVAGSDRLRESLLRFNPRRLLAGRTTR